LTQKSIAGLPTQVVNDRGRDRHQAHEMASLWNLRRIGYSPCIRLIRSDCPAP